MKGKIYNLLLVITSLFGYLEWGKENHLFLFQAEAEIFKKFFTSPDSVLHPFILLPFAGQILLLLTLLQKQPNRIMTFIGLGCIGILLAFMLFVGCLSLNIKIILSTLPFLIIAFLTIKFQRSNKGNTTI